MGKKLKKALKWLLLGVVFGTLTVVFYIIERETGGRYRLTAGCGMITAVCLIAAGWSLTGKMNDQAGMMVVEDVFAMNSGGCVVVGGVHGVLWSGERVVIVDRAGKEIKTKIGGIEINRKNVRAAADTPVALYFKDIELNEINKGDVVIGII